MLGIWERTQLDDLVLSISTIDAPTLITDEDDELFTQEIVRLFQTGSTPLDLNGEDVYLWAVFKGWEVEDAAHAGTVVTTVYQTLKYLGEIQ